MPKIFQELQQPAKAAREFILTITETQMPASQAIQPTQQSKVTTKEQQQPRGQPTSFLVVDNGQAGPSRPLTFTLYPMIHFGPPSVASATGKESQHNISGLSSFFGNIQSVMSFQQIDTLQRFSTPDTTSCLFPNHYHTARTSAATNPVFSAVSHTKQQQQ